jgi:hypothetical protein
MGIDETGQGAIQMEETKWNHSSKENSVNMMGQEIYWMQSSDVVLQAMGISHFTMCSSSFTWLLSVGVLGCEVYDGGGEGIMVSGQVGRQGNIGSGKWRIRVQALAFFACGHVWKTQFEAGFCSVLSKGVDGVPFGGVSGAIRQGQRIKRFNSFTGAAESRRVGGGGNRASA